MLFSYLLYSPPDPLLPFFCLFLFCFCLFVCLFSFSFCFVVVLVFGLFVASDFLTTICHLAIVNVCVIIILSIGNTQMSILLLCFLYLFVELMITVNEYNFVSTKYTVCKSVCVHFPAREI